MAEVIVANGDPDRFSKLLRVLGWGAVAFIILAQLVAMRFNDAVNWTTSDFVFVGVLLIGGAGVIELVAWRARSSVVRIGLVLFVVALIWIEGAVGIFR